MVVICKCSHEQHCTELERIRCPHSIPHAPTDWNEGDDDGPCDKLPITCNAGSDGTVICDVLHIFDPAPESLTCYRCRSREGCHFVDDLYNTDGDCLASK